MTELKIAPKIKVLGSECNNGKIMTPEQMLNEVLSQIKNKERIYGTANKAIVILLDDTNEDYPYTTTWHQAGMKMSECLSLSIVTQRKFLEEMRG